jgi:RNA polymerase sigma-70 factor (ECF subfamily)
VTRPAASREAGEALLALYDRALPEVYGYLLHRCGDVPLAEDLTAETFLAAVAATRSPAAVEPTVGWLIGTARHKLADHWRHRERERRRLAAVAAEPREPDDPWEARLDVLRAREVLARLGPHHRAALVLRYVDGLPVPQVADVLGRSVYATEALLVRARAAFRATYRAGDDPVDDGKEDDRD